MDGKVNPSVEFLVSLLTEVIVPCSQSLLSFECLDTNLSYWIQWRGTVDEWCTQIYRYNTTIRIRWQLCQKRNRPYRQLVINCNWQYKYNDPSSYWNSETFIRRLEYIHIDLIVASFCWLVRVSIVIEREEPYHFGKMLWHFHDYSAYFKLQSLVEICLHRMSFGRHFTMSRDSI